MAGLHHPRTEIVQQWSPSNPLTLRSLSRSPVNGHRTNGCLHDDTPPLSPNETAAMEADEDRMWRDEELNRKIMNMVEENGITRPKGLNVSFHYNSTVEEMHFGRTHPMKPWRLTLTKHLVLAYGLQYAMDTYQAVAAGKDQVCAFHDADYVDFLSKVSPETFKTLCADPKFVKAVPPKHDGDNVELGPYNLSTSPGADCPVFADMSTYLFLYTGATLGATKQLINGQSDIAINWSGGLHHAHKAEASGFCYINDIVLSILDMLAVWPRVLYIDIDVHHGDGVEEAFARQPRVMTLSFHRFGPYDETGHRFFPGTGDISDVGLKGTVGEHFALNVPIPSGIDDRQYKHLFESIVANTVQSFKPSAIVLQCGADSLGGDRLGQFNINIKQHGECIAFVKNFHIPLLLIGGGGYTARNVARAWCHETALATNNTLPDHIPLDFVPRPEAFSGKPNGDGKLYPQFQRVHANDCKDADLDDMIKKIDWELRYVRNAPWVLMDHLPPQRVIEDLVRKGDQMMEAGRAERERKRRERNPGEKMY